MSLAMDPSGWYRARSRGFRSPRGLEFCPTRPEAPPGKPNRSHTGDALPRRTNPLAPAARLVNTTSSRPQLQPEELSAALEALAARLGIPVRYETIDRTLSPGPSM